LSLEYGDAGDLVVQRYVEVRGALRRFPDGVGCRCLLCPEGLRDLYCEDDCPTEIEERIYHDCTEDEVLQELLPVFTKPMY
jgi:hypothetical protein